MDQELAAFLSQHFSAIDQHFSAIDQRFASMEQRMEERFTSIEQRMEERFAETGQQIQTLQEDFQEFRQETVQRLDRLEDRVQGAYILIEDMRDKISLVAEAAEGGREQMEHKIEELSRKIDETASFNRQSYEALEVRVRTLEAAKKVRTRKGGPRQD